MSENSERRCLDWVSSRSKSCLLSCSCVENSKKSRPKTGEWSLRGKSCLFKSCSCVGKKPKMPFHRLVTQTLFSLRSNLVCSTRNKDIMNQRQRSLYFGDSRRMEEDAIDVQIVFVFRHSKHLPILQSRLLEKGACLE